jgi:methylase of polypeptide subunit release factors
MRLDAPALTTVREYLGDLMYALVDFRMSFEADRGPNGFPRFAALQAVIERLDPVHQVAFRLLRLGESVADDEVARAMPAAVRDAFATAGILARADDGRWQTTGGLVVPVDGLLVLVGVPSSYPTARRPASPWFDLSSFVVACALPASLAGERVLDVCAGSGVQALLCARRGADRVVGLELDAHAVETARANAALNGLDGRVEFRVSDGLAALGDAETFDFVVCNTPYAPTLRGAVPPRTPSEIGNTVLLALIDELPRHLSAGGRGIVALWRAIGTAAHTFHRRAVTERLARHGFTTAAFVDRAPDTVDSVLRMVAADQGADVDADIRALLAREAPSIDGFYNEIVAFRRGGAGGASGLAFGLALPTARAAAAPAAPRPPAPVAAGA